MANLFGCGLSAASEAPDTITLTFSFSAKSNQNAVVTQNSYADFYVGEYTRCTNVTYSGDSSINLTGVPSVGPITPYTTQRISINAIRSLIPDEYLARGVSITLAK